MKTDIEIIIQNTLPGFWFNVSIWKGFDGTPYLAIKIAACNHLINGVAGQRVQDVSLCLDLNTLELAPQVFGGSGGQSIYRKPNLSDPKEKYLAMKSVKIPFRKPLQTEEAVLKAIQRFCQKYKQALAENFSELMYHDLVDYDKVLNCKLLNI